MLSAVEQYLNPHGVLITIVNQAERKVFARVAHDSQVKSAELDPEMEAEEISSLTINDILLTK